MTENNGKGVFTELYDKFFGKSWPMWVGSILLAILSIVLTIFASPWGQSGGVTNIGQNIFGWESQKIIDNRYAMLGILTFMGSMAAALFAKQYNIRIPPFGELMKGLVGGAFMGVGANLGLGCTLGSFFSGWAALSGGALVFTLGLVIGVYIAVRWLVFEIDKFPGISTGKTITLSLGSDKRFIQPILGLLLVVGAFYIVTLYDVDVAAEKILIGFVIVGLLIGIILQRSRFCIVRALREPFMSGDSAPALAVMAGILVGVAGIGTMKFVDATKEPIFVFGHFWMAAIIGGTLFGFGMTLAGGCCVGSIWRAGEGQVKLMMAVIGMLIMLPVTTKYLKEDFFNAIPDQDTNYLPEQYGYAGAYAIILLIMAFWYWIVKWNDRSRKLCVM